MFRALFLMLLLRQATAEQSATIPTLKGPELEELEMHDTTSQRLMRHLMKKRGLDIVKPKRNISQPVVITFKIELYQVIELNERQQYVSVSAWVIERWHDEFLYWNPEDFDNITEVKIPHHKVWIPDTTLYNTLIMKDDDQRRLLHVKLTTDYKKRRSHVEFLYPAIYKFYCRLYLQFFPFDSQTCHMLFGSWTSDSLDIDYSSMISEVGTTNYIPNEGWSMMGTFEGEPAHQMGTSRYLPNEEWELVGTMAERKEIKYVCCPNNYTLLDYTLYLRRRPLFYLVNLVIPTFIITLIAITGFFTTSSTTGIREEKISLCITTLLSMSILMLMVSDQMPSTSTFIPLISWFYMCAIIIISVGALAASFVISVQKFGRLGERLPTEAVRMTRIFSQLSLTRIPAHLQSKDRLLQNLKKKKKVESRPSTIAQFAKYMFTAGTEIPTYSTPNPNMYTVVGYPQVHQINGSNGCEPNQNKENGSEPENGRQNSTDERRRRRSQFQRMQSTFSDGGEEEKPSNRHLAKIEYDWLATVIERCTFLIFLLCFLCVSLGINFVGFLHWINSHPPHYVAPIKGK